MKSLSDIEFYFTLQPDLVPNFWNCLDKTNSESYVRSLADLKAKLDHTFFMETQELLPRGLTEEIMITAGLRKWFEDIDFNSKLTIDQFDDKLIKKSHELFKNGSISTKAFELYIFEKSPKIQTEMGIEDQSDLTEILRVMVSLFPYI